MKVIIFAIILFALNMCKEDDPFGGYRKRTISKNDTAITEAFIEAFNFYNNKIGPTIDIIVPLTAYSKLVNGNLYLLTFMDKTSEFPTVHEYEILVPFPNEKELISPKLEKHFEYDGSDGLLKYDEKEFTLIEKKLYQCLKKQNQQLHYIIYSYPVETSKYKFYVISADTENGQHLYVLGHEKESDVFDVFQEIR